MAARRNIRAGVRGGDILVEPEALVEHSPHRSILDFRGAWHGDREPRAAWLLQAGMVLSMKQQCCILGAALSSLKTRLPSLKPSARLSATCTVVGIQDPFKIWGRPRAGPTALKMIIVDICLCENQRWPEQDLVLCGELQVAETTRRDEALCRIQSAIKLRFGNVDGGVADVDRAP